MLRVTKRVNTDIEYQIALGLPCTEHREQVLERRGDRTVICIADSEGLVILIVCERFVARRVCGVVLVVEL